MAGEIFLHDLAYNFYHDEMIRSHLVRNHVVLSLLGENRVLTWDEILQLRGCDTLKELPGQLLTKAATVFYAKAIESVVASPALTSEQAKLIVEALTYLSTIFNENLNLQEDLRSLNGTIVLSILQAQECSELISFYRLLITLHEKNISNSIERTLTTLRQKYQTILSQNNTGHSIETLKNKLYALLDWKELNTQERFGSIEGIIVSVALSRIPLSATTAQERKDLLGLLQKLEIQDEVSRQSIEEYVQLYGTQDPSHRHHVLEQVPLDAHPIRSFSQQEEYVIEPSNVEISGDPISANPDSDPRIYVYPAIFTHRGYRYEAVVKQFKSKNEGKVKAASEKEGKILSHLNGKGPYFLTYFGQYLEVNPNGDHCFCVVMERCKSNLMKKITKRKEKGKPFKEDELLWFTRSLLDAFNIMRMHKIYHYDVKPHNILIANDGNLKICDFNISVMSEDSAFTTIPTGTVPIQGTSGYMAPEIQAAFDQRRRKEEVEPIRSRPGRIDCYGVGLVLLQLATLESVEGLNREQNQDLLQQKIQSIPIAWYRDMLRDMLQLDFNKRPSIKTILKGLHSKTTEAKSIAS